MSKELIRELQNLQIQEDSVVIQLAQISSRRKELLQVYRNAKTTERKQTLPDQTLPAHRIGDTVLYSNTGKTQVFNKREQVSAIGRVFINLTTDNGTKVRRQTQNLRTDPKPSQKDD